MLVHGEDGGGKGAAPAAAQNLVSPWEQLYKSVHNQVERIVAELQRRADEAVRHHHLGEAGQLQVELKVTQGLAMLMEIRQAAMLAGRSGDADLSWIGEEPAGDGAVDAGAAGVGVVDPDDVGHGNEPASKMPWF